MHSVQYKVDLLNFVNVNSKHVQPFKFVLITCYNL
jgi:hypothetical protein